jgi:hypothetical protein
MGKPVLHLLPPGCPAVLGRRGVVQLRILQQLGLGRKCKDAAIRISRQRPLVDLYNMETGSDDWDIIRLLPARAH